jgi:hypothetical protein
VHSGNRLPAPKAQEDRTFKPLNPCHSSLAGMTQYSRESLLEQRRLVRGFFPFSPGRLRQLRLVGLVELVTLQV